MEVPEWVRIVSHGTDDELSTFIRANPGFDWDGTVFDGCSAFWYAWKYNSFPLCMLATLHTEGGATFEGWCCGRGTPLEFAAYRDDARLAEVLILQYGVGSDSVRLLLGSEANVREVILEHSTTLSKATVNKALESFKDNDRYRKWDPTPASNSHRASLSRWLVSHDCRRDASLCVAWTLSQLTGTMWPDTREPLLERLMETRVREW